MYRSANWHNPACKKPPGVQYYEHTNRGDHLSLYSQMSVLPLSGERSASYEGVLHAIASGWGHIPMYEYPVFCDIDEDFEADLITYDEFLLAITDTCRAIYNDPDYDGDEGFHSLLTALEEAAPGRFVA